MTIIIKDPLETTCALCTTTTVEESVNDPDLASTTISALSSSLSTQMSRPAIIRMDYANRYMDSLSVEQLYEMEQRLEAKENEFIMLENNGSKEVEKPKVMELKKI